MLYGPYFPKDVSYKYTSVLLYVTKREMLFPLSLPVFKPRYHTLSPSFLYQSSLFSYCIQSDVTSQLFSLNFRLKTQTYSTGHYLGIWQFEFEARLGRKYYQYFSLLVRLEICQLRFKIRLFVLVLIDDQGHSIQILSSLMPNSTFQ